MARPIRDGEPVKRRRRATTAEARERQLVALAHDKAEEQLRNGTASAQVITHFLKLGTAQANLEREKLRNENELLKARVDSLASQARMEEIYSQALSAMRAYSGQVDTDEDYD